MISWEINEGCITKIFYKGKNLILPWGVETADDCGHFSLELFKGYRFKVLRKLKKNTSRVLSKRKKLASKKN